MTDAFTIRKHCHAPTHSPTHSLTHSLTHSHTQAKVAEWTAGGKLRRKHSTRAMLDAWMDKQCSKALQRQDRARMRKVVATSTCATDSTKGVKDEVEASSAGRMAWMLPPSSSN